MSLLLAAIGATATALIELTVVPHLRVGDAHPHLVLVFGVIWTIGARLEDGLAWAFVGGFVLDVLAQRPLGSTSFALLLVVAGAAVVGRALSRLRPLAPIVAAAPLSLLYSMILFLLFGALGTDLPSDDLGSRLLPGVAYDVLLAALVGPLVIAVRDRATDADRVAW